MSNLSQSVKATRDIVNKIMLRMTHVHCHVRMRIPIAEVVSQLVICGVIGNDTVGLDDVVISSFSGSNIEANFH